MPKLVVSPLPLPDPSRSARPEWPPASWRAVVLAPPPRGAPAPTTKLRPEQEAEFRQWLSVAKPPVVDDLRGHWLALRSGGPQAVAAERAQYESAQFDDGWPKSGQPVPRELESYGGMGGSATSDAGGQ